MAAALSESGSKSVLIGDDDADGSEDEGGRYALDERDEMLLQGFPLPSGR